MAAGTGFMAREAFIEHVWEWKAQSGGAITRLAEDLVYRTVAGDPMRTQVTQVLAHFFNHQTHHRGQAHAMLAGKAEQLAVEAAAGDDGATQSAHAKELVLSRRH